MYLSDFRIVYEKIIIIFPFRFDVKNIICNFFLISNRFIS